MKTVHIYTDGSCLGNPGPGGWSAILLLPDTIHRKEIFGGFRLTTNNRMEIFAVIQAVKALKEACTLEIFTDSQYVCNAFAKGWIYKWQNMGWIRKKGELVPNTDLWQILLQVLKPHHSHFNWLRGHIGHKENERCDYLAKAAAESNNLAADLNFEEHIKKNNE